MRRAGYRGVTLIPMMLKYSNDFDSPLPVPLLRPSRVGQAWCATVFVKLSGRSKSNEEKKKYEKRNFLRDTCYCHGRPAHYSFASENLGGGNMRYKLKAIIVFRL